MAIDELLAVLPRPNNPLEVGIAEDRQRIPKRPPRRRRPYPSWSTRPRLLVRRAP